MLIRRHSWIAILFICLCFFACKKIHHHVTPAFYYWKVKYHLTDFEKHYLDTLQCRKIYLHFCDVTWDSQYGQPIPVGSVHLPPVMDTTNSYVPVVFITPDVVQKLNKESLEKLASNLANYLQQIATNAKITPVEIQMDCDWSSQTRDAYFGFLRSLKQQPYMRGKVLSCTLRMHQIKYSLKNGIPPVDRGLLMCYSMGDLKKPGVRNSLFDADEAEKYLSHIDHYELPLDIALPVFRWSLLFRQGKFQGILRDIQPDDIKTSGAFNHQQDNLYECANDTLWNGYRMFKGDIVRVEDATFKDLERIARYTSRRIKNEDLAVVFYHCDSLTLSKYSTHELETLYNIYR